MTKSDPQKTLTRDDVFADFGRRVKNGYDPGRVERHLRKVADGVADLVSRINGDQDVSESVELVMKATHKSVDAALSDARSRADEIVGFAESHAVTITVSAEESAANLLREAEESVADRIREAESTLGAINELINTRQKELAEFEAKVAKRVSELRSASDSIRDIAQDVSLPIHPPEVIDLDESDLSNDEEIPEVDLTLDPDSFPTRF